MEHLEEAFEDGRTRKARDSEVDRDALYEQIGRLKMELEWLKKKLACWNAGSSRCAGTRASTNRIDTRPRIRAIIVDEIH